MITTNINKNNNNSQPVFSTYCRPEAVPWALCVFSFLFASALEACLWHILHTSMLMLRAINKWQSGDSNSFLLKKLVISSFRWKSEKSDISRNSISPSPELNWLKGEEMTSRKRPASHWDPVRILDSRGQGCLTTPNAQTGGHWHRPSSPPGLPLDARSWQYIVFATHFQTVHHFGDSKTQVLSGWKLRSRPWNRCAPVRKFTPYGSSSSQVVQPLKLSESQP